MTEIVLAPQNFIKRGWILVRDNKFWGEIYPEDRSHGGGSAMYGWTNDIRKAQIAEHEKSRHIKDGLPMPAIQVKLDGCPKVSGFKLKFLPL